MQDISQNQFRSFANIIILFLQTDVADFQLYLYKINSGLHYHHLDLVDCISNHFDELIAFDFNIHNTQSNLWLIVCKMYICWKLFLTWINVKT